MQDRDAGIKLQTKTLDGTTYKDCFSGKIYYLHLERETVGISMVRGIEDCLNPTV